MPYFSKILSTHHFIPYKLIPYKNKKVYPLLLDVLFGLPPQEERDMASAMEGGISVDP